MKRRNVKVSGTVAGQPARFLPAHLEFGNAPAATQVTLSVPVSYEDLAAVLYAWTTRNAEQAGYPLDSLLNDPSHMDEMLLFGLLCRYKEFRAASREIANLIPGTPDWERYIRIQTAVLNRYTSDPAGCDASRGSARRLEVAR